MNIIAHRGLWKTDSEKNTLIALKRALESGFGFETDFRDCGGKILISHNPPKGNELEADKVFDMYNQCHSDKTLALNIKADDLSDKYYTIVRPISIPHASLKRRNAIINIENRPLLYYPIIAMISDIKHLLFGKKKTIITDFETDADNWIASWKKEFSIYDLHNSFALINKDRFDDSVIALKNILSFCVEHGFKPVIVLPPMTKHLSIKFDETIRKRIIYDFIIEANTVEARVLDYINNPVLSDDVNFNNAFFMNINGARLFSKQVINDICIK